MYNVTSFKANSAGKRAFSPYNDNTFDFKTFQVETLEGILREASQNFILNIPLNKSVRTFRRKENLSKYIDNTINYFIVDVDKIYTKETLNKVLNYFKNYKCILLESRSYNGVDYFSIKGVLECNLELKHLKYAIQKIHYDLIDLADFDQSVSRIGTLNAPIGKFNVLLDNSSCKNIIRFSDISVLPKKVSAITDEFAFNEINLDNLDTSDISTVDDLCLKVFSILGFKAISTNSDNSISFSHPSEVKTPGGYFWFRNSPYTMHHFNKSKTVNIFKLVKNSNKFKELVSNSINYDKELKEFNVKNKVITVDSKFLSITPEIESSIVEFIEGKDGIYTIKSPMGTGKSTVIKRIIQEGLQNDMRILIITNRISVAEDFKSKYNIKIYNKDEYSIGDSLICQFDSLWKYNIKNFDLVILDEFISLLFHARNTINNSQINLAKFFASFNLKLVIADAFLTGYENKLLNKNSNMFFLNNVYRDETKLYEYNNFNYFIQKILRKAEEGRVTISSTSLSFINALFILLRKLNYRVLVLTAETPPSVKERIYQIFNDENSDDYDVLLYSPTLTVGVSNLNKIDTHFHYDSSMTTDVISSLQMIKRTRKTKEIHFYIKNRINFLKTTFNEIRDEYISEIGKYAEHNFLFELNDYGEAKLSKLGKSALMIDCFKNILEFNHKNAFLYLLKMHFKNSPSVVENSFESNILLKYQKENKENKEKLLEETFNQYLLLNDIDKNELPKNSSSEKIYEIDSNLKLISNERKKEIFRIAIKDSSFILKCKYYSLLKGYLDKEIDDVKLQIIVSSAIIRNNTEVVDFISKIKNIKDFSFEYKSSSIKDKNIQYFCKKLGFKYFSNGDGTRKYSVDPKIVEFSDDVILNFD